jgi:hypothetical protein
VLSPGRLAGEYLPINFRCAFLLPGGLVRL